MSSAIGSSAALTLLGQVGRMSFPHRTGRGGGATHARVPHRGDKAGSHHLATAATPSFDGGADPENVVRVKTRDFR